MKLSTTILSSLLFALALVAADDTKTTKPAASAPSAPVTDAQRLRFRELERDYAQQQVVITQAQAAQAASQTAQEKQAKIQQEATTLIQAMQSSCKATEDWDGASLKCNPKVEAKAAAPAPKEQK